MAFLLTPFRTIVKRKASRDSVLSFGLATQPAQRVAKSAMERGEPKEHEVALVLAILQIAYRRSKLPTTTIAALKPPAEAV